MISIKSNIEEFMKDLDDIAKTQIPFATALALNDLARGVMAAEVAEIEKDFPTATPFTKNAMGYIPANKNNLITTVFVKDIQAVYLEPYADGGMSVPAQPRNVAMLTPKNIGLNSYGNIPYKKIQNLMAGGNVFAGTIKTKSGQQIGGVFQRLQGIKNARRLKILVRFTDPHPVKEIFEFEQRATAYVEKNFQNAMEQALLKALGSMK